MKRNASVVILALAGLAMIALALACGQEEKISGPVEGKTPATTATAKAPAPTATVATIPAAIPVSPTPKVEVPPTQPPPPPPPAQATLQLVSVTSPVPAGGNATVVVQAGPGASCSIMVIYKSGPSEAQGLGPKQAGSDGRVSWTWKVGTRTTPGNWPINVTCDGQTISTAFTVT